VIDSLTLVTGHRIRAVSTLDTIDERDPLTVRLIHHVTVEIEGEENPAVRAVWTKRLVF